MANSNPNGLNHFSYLHANTEEGAEETSTDGEGTTTCSCCAPQSMDKYSTETLAGKLDTLQYCL